MICPAMTSSPTRGSGPALIAHQGSQRRAVTRPASYHQPNGGQARGGNAKMTSVDTAGFVQELVGQVTAFCHTLDTKPPAYSYIPLSNDQQRVRVMQSRLFNECRAADLFGTWL